jgi:hypothetical protein
LADPSETPAEQADLTHFGIYEGTTDTKNGVSLGCGAKNAVLYLFKQTNYNAIENMHAMCVITWYIKYKQFIFYLFQATSPYNLVDTHLPTILPSLVDFFASPVPDQSKLGATQRYPPAVASKA